MKDYSTFDTHDLFCKNCIFYTSSEKRYKRYKLKYATPQAQWCRIYSKINAYIQLNYEKVQKIL